jgi:hypothetical protein
VNRKIIIGAIAAGVIIVGILSLFGAGFIYNSGTSGSNITNTPPNPPAPKHYTLQLNETAGPAAKP